jgi:transposase
MKKGTFKISKKTTKGKTYYTAAIVKNVRERLEESFPLIAKKFNQDLSRLYYDITLTYFEGVKVRIALYGYSRDRRPDKKQIVIGLVSTSDGFPLKVLIYEGNRCDKSTIQELLEEIKKTFPNSEITSEEIVNAYKQLTTVERAFRCLKDTLEIRPVYHWKEERVKAHIYICVISYLFYTAMEYLLKRNNIQLGADTFLKKG